MVNPKDTKVAYKMFSCYGKVWDDEQVNLSKD